MIDKRVLDVDPLTGEVEMFYYDEADESVTIETSVDIQPLIELNSAQYNAHKHTPWGDGAKVASVPLNVFMEEQQKGTWDDADRFNRWINDPDNRVFRTRPGRVTVKH